MITQTQMNSGLVLPGLMIGAGFFTAHPVLDTQQHLTDCLRSGQQAESEGRAYLQHIQLVEDAYSFNQSTLASA